MALKPGSILTANEYLSVDDYIESPNRKYYAIMQGDGNFVVYRGTRDDPQGALWATNTYGDPGSFFAVMQGDGNFVVYRGTRDDPQGALWATSKHGNPGDFFAIMQDDGNFVVYRGTSPTDQQGPWWATNVFDPVDPSRWMEHLGGTIAGRHPGRLCIPGTHDSGSYTWQMTIGVRCQDKNFGEQMERGIRYLDLRVRYNHPGFRGYYLCHGKVTASDLQLVPALQQVRDFIDRHPKEIVLLDFHELNEGGADPGSMSKDAVDSLKGIIRECFAGKLVARPDDPNRLTVEDIWAKHQNIIVFMSDGGNDLWRQSDIQYAWDQYATDFGKLPSKKPSHLHDYMTNELKHRSTPFFNMGLTITTINLLHAATHIINPRIPGWLDGWFHDSSTKNNMNAIAVDFFDHPDGTIVQKMIYQNMYM